MRYVESHDSHTLILATIDSIGVKPPLDEDFHLKDWLFRSG